MPCDERASGEFVLVGRMDAVPTPKFQLSLLGRFELSGPDGPIELTSKKLAALLAFLACTAPQTHSRDKLMTLLWGSHFDAQARQNLRQALTRLRRALGQDTITGDGETVGLQPGAIQTDVVLFEALLSDGGRDALNRAIGIYEGSLLPDIAIPEAAWTEWVDAERQRLEGLALDAMVKLSEQELEAGNHEHALDSGNRALVLSNLREDAHRLIMRALSAGGRRADALKHYEDLKALLKRELAVEPDPSTKALAAELRNLHTPRSASEAGSGPLSATASERGAAVLLLPDRPSIAVLPFANIGGDPAQEYFADGVVEEIIIALSRMRWLFVISHHSSFTFKRRAVDVKQAARELGVRYVLEGSVRKAANRVRIAAQLIDASTGAHIWADRFEDALEDIFDVQDKVTESVIRAIAPKLEQAEIERAKHKPTESLDAYDCYLRGIAKIYEWKKESTDDARRLLHRAIELDPDFAAAHALAAFCYVQRKSSGWMADRIDEIAETARLAKQAVALGKDDAVALCWSSFALAYVVNDADAGATFVDRALGLNPNLAAAWLSSGWIRIWLGNPILAIEHLAHALRLSPLDPRIGGMHAATAHAHLFAGRCEEASLWAEKALWEQPNLPAALRASAASNALAGRLDKARQVMARLRQLDPAVRCSNLREVLGPYRRVVDLARLEEGLRKAGLPQ
jgi:TolB-like protein/DNA-binding SARP family transcriptional activator